MTLTGLALILTLVAVAWMLFAVAVSFGLGALVARNRTTYAPAPRAARQPVAAASTNVAHAA